jgi:predicted phage terminase large subunit-like protein
VRVERTGDVKTRRPPVMKITRSILTRYECRPPSLLADFSQPFPRVTIIEDKASGTQLIQDLIYDGVPGIRSYEPPPGEDKIMRMHSCSSTIENGFVYLPEKAEWLDEYLHEFRLFPRGRHDDQVDSTSQALDWVRQLFQQSSQVTITTVRL